METNLNKIMEISNLPVTVKCSDQEIINYGCLFIPGSLSPFERYEIYETPIDNYLIPNDFGRTTGSVTSLKGEGVFIEFELTKKGFESIESVLCMISSLNFPSGARITTGVSTNTNQTLQFGESEPEYSHLCEHVDVYLCLPCSTYKEFRELKEQFYTDIPITKSIDEFLSSKKYGTISSPTEDMLKEDNPDYDICINLNHEGLANFEELKEFIKLLDIPNGGTLLVSNILKKEDKEDINPQLLSEVEKLFDGKNPDSLRFDFGSSRITEDETQKFKFDKMINEQAIIPMEVFRRK